MPGLTNPVHSGFDLNKKLLVLAFEAGLERVQFGSRRFGLQTGEPGVAGPQHSSGGGLRA